MSDAKLPDTVPPAAPPPRRELSMAQIMSTMVFLGALFLPAYFYGDDRYWLPLYSKFMALAIFAISVDLVWGYTGLLSLGQGVYFGLGAYAMGYCLVLQRAAEKAGKPFVAAPDMAMPDFMEYTRRPDVPFLIRPLIDLRLSLALMILIPVLVAMIFGWFSFRMRVKGVFFSLVTQMLLLAVFTLIYNNQPITGGVVGMRDLAKIQVFGYKFDYVGYFYLTTAFLCLCFLLSLTLIKSKFGKVLTAIRDNEFRVQALGYNTALYKTFVFAFAAALAGLAGGLYVSSQGTAGLDRFGVGFSIEIVIWVAVGGRGTLYGAVLGAILVNWANTQISNEYPEAWRYILGMLFIGTVVFLPEGIVGGLRSLGIWAWKKYSPPETEPLALPLPSAAAEAKETPAPANPVLAAPPPTQPLVIPATDVKGV
jgi:urea transport system permease protein